MIIDNPVIKLLSENKEQVAQVLSKNMMEINSHLEPAYIHSQSIAFLDYLTDVHVPATEHYQYMNMSSILKLIGEVPDPVWYIIRSSYIFRSRILLFILERFKDYDPQTIFEATEYMNDRMEKNDIQALQYFYELNISSIREQREIINELHEERLSLVGKMAASMAHEIRNPLTAIDGFVKFMRTKLSKDALAQVEDYMTLIEQEIKNIQMQITGFLGFSRKNSADEPFRVVPVKELVDSVYVLLQSRIINENIELTVDLQEHFSLYAQTVSVQQVISNIINNGIDALSEVSGSKMIKINTFQSEDCYCIGVENNGPPIPQDIQKNLFEPFVTGKKSGTGLGLAICKQIMMKNGGDIDFVSNDWGTKFVLKFLKGWQQKNL